MSFVDPRNPNIIKMRAARELRRRKAIKRREIREQNPSINPGILERCVEAQIAQEDIRAAEEKARQQKPRSPRQGNRGQQRKPPTTVVNTTLRQGVRQWKDDAVSQGMRILKFHPAK
jgi:hypothetical protein